MIKGELLVITYSNIIRQIYKISKSTQELNTKLYKMYFYNRHNILCFSGHEIGLRVADEYNDRSVSRLNPAQNAKGFIKGIVEQYLGIEMFLTNDDIKFLKRKHVYDLEYEIRENHLSDFVLMPESHDLEGSRNGSGSGNGNGGGLYEGENDNLNGRGTNNDESGNGMLIEGQHKPQKQVKFNYLSIVCGFIAGAVETMSFKAEVTVSKEEQQEQSKGGQQSKISKIAVSSVIGGGSGIEMMGVTKLRVKMEKEIKNDD